MRVRSRFHALRSKLKEIPGVHRAGVDEETGDVWLAYEAEADASTVEQGARAALAEFGAAPDTQITLVPVAEAVHRQRVRFIGVESSLTRDVRVRVGVALEWRGQRTHAEVIGERGLMSEIRTAAVATLRALEQLGMGSGNIQVIGAKQLRAFDEDLMVVSLSAGPRRHLVGAVLVKGEPLRAASLAVLDGLNRVLGNFVELPNPR